VFLTFDQNIKMKHLPVMTNLYTLFYGSRSHVNIESQWLHREIFAAMKITGSYGSQRLLWKISGCNRSHWLLSSPSIRVRRWEGTKHRASPDDWRAHAICKTASSYVSCSSEKRLRRYDLACMMLTAGVLTKAEGSGPAK
jgi:hypothetical protein